MSKVKVSKKVYDAFKVTERSLWFLVDKEKYLRCMISYKLDRKFNSITSALNEISYETFLKALNDGYELELTPREKVLREYNELKFLLSWSRDKEQRESIENSMKTIVITLNNLEIYIEGVNK